jgi:hypothetical protein
MNCLCVCVIEKKNYGNENNYGKKNLCIWRSAFNYKADHVVTINFICIIFFNDVCLFFYILKVQVYVLQVILREWLYFEFFFFLFS